MPRRVRTHTNPLRRFPALAPPRWDEVFARPDRPFALEFGCAKGEFLTSFARIFHGWNILGVEVRKPLAQAAAETIKATGLTNAGVLYGNIAGRLAEFIPRGRLDAVFVFFPDPWKKTKHLKRRLFQPELAAELAALMPSGARLVVLTDQPGLAEDIAGIIEATAAFAARPLPPNLPKSAWQEFCDRDGRPYQVLCWERTAARKRSRADEEIPVLIVGAGLSGLAVARELPRGSFLICDSEREPGGLCRSFVKDGFTFDCSGHLLHACGEALAQAENLLPGGWGRHERRARTRLLEREVPFPVQAHLGRLPAAARDRCLAGFLAAADRLPDASSLAAWYRTAFGEGLFQLFFRPYNEKLFNAPLETLTAEWAAVSPRPTLAEVEAGARGEEIRGLGYNAEFRYPRQGGIGALIRAMTDGLVILTATALVALEPKKRRALLRNASGEERRLRYRHLVSTAPLPQLVAMTSNAPEKLRGAAKQLRAVGVHCLNLGLTGGTTDAHWTYFAEPEFPFFRVGAYHNFSPQPKGHSALYIETTYSRREEIPDDLEARALAGLRRAGWIKGEVRVAARAPVWIDAAYALPLPGRAEAVAAITEYYTRHAVTPLGRYGRWTYTSMSEALSEGRAAGLRLAAGVKTS